MNDSYKEILVKRQTPVGMRVLKGALIGLTVLSLVAGLLMWPLLIVGAILIAVDYFVVPKFDVEYEYLYVDKQLTVDKIMARTRRKKVETFDMERMEILAPIKSWHLDDYKNRQLKEVNYSSGVEQQPDIRYCMIYNGEKRVIFEPNAAMVTAIKSVAPRKVFTD